MMNMHRIMKTKGMSRWGIPCLGLMMMLLAWSMTAGAQTGPTVTATAHYALPDGTTSDDENPLAASAPVEASFTLNVENASDYDVTFQWTIKDTEDSTFQITRYDAQMDYTFRTAGSFCIVWQATLNRSGLAEPLVYNNQDDPYIVTISESKLDFPNAFSPNGDGINDIYKAKEGYQSIVEFDAYIFNRWGKKLYEWHDPSGGWDGTYEGKDVKQGVYFVLVKARGADGRRFNIKKDVNLLRGYTETTSTTE